MPLKVNPIESGNCGCYSRNAQTYWPKTFHPPMDPCKDACGAWKKFRVRVRKGCPVCVTFINLGDTEVLGFSYFNKKGCPVYKPMKDLSGLNNSESCELMLLKCGNYEFRTKDGGSFPKYFDWHKSELTPDDMSNILTAGQSHAVF